MKITKIIRHPLTTFSISLVVITLLLMFRNTGLYPSVFADEYTYSRISRILPMNSAWVPSYIYLKLYSFTNYCGDNFLGCARLINVVAFIIAAPFIFLIARRVATPGISILVSLLAILGPINSYTAYFMPESCFFLGFWFFSWYLLTLDINSSKYSWFVVGGIYAVTALIKPHAIFFLPAIVTYIAFLFYLGQNLFSRATATAYISFLIGALLIKFGTSYFFAGETGLTFFGPMYNSMAAPSSTGIDKYIQLLTPSFESLKGHLIVLALIYGLPFSIAMTTVGVSLLKKPAPDIQENSQNFWLERISFLSIMVCLNLICVASLFTGVIANSGPYETPYRLHMRYYNFALPLFYIVAAGALTNLSETKKNTRYILGTFIGTFAFYGIFSRLAPYTPTRVDSPEIYGLLNNRFLFYTISGLSALSLLAWIFFSVRFLRLYLIFVLPLFVGASLYHVQLELNHHMKPDVYDEAGIFAKKHLASEAIPKTVIVGSDDSGLFKAMFYLDSYARDIIVSKDAAYDLSKLPQDKEWVLLIGDHKLIGSYVEKVPMNGFTLVHVSPR